MNLELLIGWMFKPVSGYTLTDCLVICIESLILIGIIYLVAVIISGVFATIELEEDRENEK